MGYGNQYVAVFGIIMMQKLSADSLDMIHKVYTKHAHKAYLSVYVLTKMTNHEVKHIYLTSTINSQM